MPKKANSDIKAMAAKQARQKDMLAAYKKQRQWLTWAAIIIAILVLLLIASLGYASNWWLGNATRTSSFTPTTPDTTSTTNPAGTNTSTEGGGGGSRTTTTNNSTTTNTSTTTNNTTPAPTPPSNSLLQLNADTQLGDDINAILDEARSLGLHVDCHTEALIVRVCSVSDDNNNTITLKSLLTGDGITGVTLNF